MTIYAASTGPKYERILSWIGAGKRVLDVGCGAGAFTARIAQGNDVVESEGGTSRHRLYMWSDGLWEQVGEGWSLLVSVAEDQRWLFGLSE